MIEFNFVEPLFGRVIPYDMVINNRCVNQYILFHKIPRPLLFTSLWIYFCMDVTSNMVAQSNTFVISTDVSQFNFFSSGILFFTTKIKPLGHTSLFAHIFYSLSS